MGLTEAGQYWAEDLDMSFNSVAKVLSYLFNEVEARAKLKVLEKIKPGFSEEDVLWTSGPELFIEAYNEVKKEFLAPE